MVRSLGSGCFFCGSLGGWGTSASRPFGVTGTMTMKMISSTSKMSIIGVMLISPIAPPLLPVENDMASNSSVFCLVRKLLPARSARGFALLGQQADFIHARRTNGIDGVFHGAELRTRIGTDENGLARLIGELVAHLAAQFAGGYLVLPQ